jgi:hypothetical protein
VENKPKIDQIEDVIASQQIEDVVIPADKLIIFQEQKAEEDQSVEALNVAVVLESTAAGDVTTTDFITQ